MRPAVRSRLPSAAAPAAAVATVAVLDLVRTARDWPLPAVAVLDESAHLLTAWLAAAAVLGPGTPWRVLRWVLAGAVLLDLDHVPLYLGLDVTAGPSGGRPVTHSLATVAVLLAGAASMRRFRVPLAGLAAGVATQLWRDLSTGPGVPLAWPVLPDDVRLPHTAYAAALVVVAGVATWRTVRGRTRPQAAWADSGPAGRKVTAGRSIRQRTLRSR